MRIGRWKPAGSAWGSEDGRLTMSDDIHGLDEADEKFGQSSSLVEGSFSNTPMMDGTPFTAPPLPTPGRRTMFAMLRCWIPMLIPVRLTMTTVIHHASGDQKVSRDQGLG